MEVAPRTSEGLPARCIRYFFADLAGSMVDRQGFHDCSSLRSGEVVVQAGH